MRTHSHILASRSKRCVLALLIMLGSLLVTVLPSVARAADEPACTLDNKLVPACGVLWGLYSKESSGTDWPSTYLAFEQRMGRTFDIVKRYHDFSGQGTNGLFPNTKERALGVDGRTLYFAWTSQLYNRGGHVDWASIASGAYDETVVKPVARQIKSWGKSVFIDFDHEAGRRTGQGTPADYVAAYRHLREVFDRMGVTNAVWVWVGTSGDNDIVRATYPGDAYVDWVAWDPYNYHTCRNMPWRSPTATIGRWYNWLQANGFGDKPFMLAEYGTVADPAVPGSAAQWYRDLPAALATFPNVRAVVQFNTTKTCDFRIQADDVMTAFTGAAQDPHVSTRH